MSPEWSARAEEFETMARQVVAMVDAAAADPDLPFERAAALSRATENIVTAVEGLISQQRRQDAEADADFVRALEQTLGAFRAADMRAGDLVIRTCGILNVA